MFDTVTRLLILLLVFFIWLSPDRGFATSVDPKIARKIINMSGRQRMLSQRMSAASCLAMAGVDAERRRTVASDAHAEFQRVLTALQHGDDEWGVAAETEEQVLSSLHTVGEVWNEVGPSILQLSVGDLHTVVLNQMVGGNVPLLQSSNAVVQDLVQLYGAGVIDAERAKTIDIAGRQRMLSQRMMKEACLLAVGVRIEQTADSLKSTMALFQTSLADLLHGNAGVGVLTPPNAEIKTQLQKVQGLWEAYQTGLSLIEADSEASRLTLGDLANQSDLLLAEMNLAVGLYTSLAK